MSVHQRFHNFGLQAAFDDGVIPVGAATIFDPAALRPPDRPAPDRAHSRTARVIVDRGGRGGGAPAPPTPPPAS